MNLEIMWKNIRRLCTQRGVTVTQVEKDLGFSPGSMTKWRQSSPSIEKVIAVSNYFQVSLDEICGTKTDKNDETVQNLISYTKQDLIQWLPCSIYDLLNIHFYPSQMESRFSEMYTATYMNKQYFIGVRENIQDKFEYYESTNMKVAFKKEKDNEVLEELWLLIHNMMEVLEEQVFSED